MNIVAELFIAKSLLIEVQEYDLWGGESGNQRSEIKLPYSFLPEWFTSQDIVEKEHETACFQSFQSVWTNFFTLWKQTFMCSPCRKLTLKDINSWGNFEQTPQMNKQTKGLIPGLVDCTESKNIHVRSLCNSGWAQEQAGTKNEWINNNTFYL